MPYDPDKHHRRSIRLKDYDYAQPGAYFVTICTYERECFLGEIIKGQSQLTEDGEIVRVEWIGLALYHPYVELGAFVIMPNHLHGLIILTENDNKGAGPQGGLVSPPLHISPPLRSNRPDEKRRQGIPDLVRNFKTYSARKINERRDSQGLPVWQRNYYEHIVRNEQELHAIQEYIVNNPAKWEEDQDHPNRWKAQDL